MNECVAPAVVEQPSRIVRAVLVLELLGLLPLSLYAAWVLPMMLLFISPLSLAAAAEPNWGTLGLFGLGLFCTVGGAFGLFAVWGSVLSRLWGVSVGLSARREFAGITIGLVVLSLLLTVPIQWFPRSQWWLFVGPVVAALHYFVQGSLQCLRRRHAS